MKLLSASGLLGLALLSGCAKKSGSSSTGTSTDSATVTVVNGYGSGQYKIGDTVHIWSNAIPAGSVFDTWTGYNALLENAGEWHNTFVMPAQSLTLTASSRSITPFTLTYQQIKGVNILKNVYYYFGPIPTQKGIVYLLHGTGGNAQTLVNNFEWQEMINDLVDAGYAVVVTEAEEVSLNTDLNGDGKIRWELAPVDTLTNPDYGNFRALRDTFVNRGYTTVTVPRYSIGMSDGGAFSAALSYIYSFAGGVSYCAPTNALVTGSSLVPFQFCMARDDNNPEVGPTGNATASSNAAALTARNVCSPFFLHAPSPIYPQRFSRWSGISASLSAAITVELQQNHWVGSGNFLTGASDVISAAVTATPGSYPVLSGLNPAQLNFTYNEIDIMYAAHQFYSDYNRTTIHFLGSPCE